jgi:transcription elongation factor GreA
MADFPLTPEGWDNLKKELRRLKTEVRREISREIGEARELGDLSENFEYHSAKDRQGQVEAQIRDMEDKLSRAVVIDPETLSGARVVFGARVVIQLLDGDEEERTYQIVGETESEVESGKISVGSALARALIGKEVGDEIQIPSKTGPRPAEIIDVSFGRHANNKTSQAG